MSPRIRRIGRALGIAALLLAAALAIAVYYASSRINDSIHARGRVVDAETGAPLEDVEMRVRQLTFSVLAEGFGRQSIETHRVDGDFDVACRPCFDLSMYFTKAGYHPRYVRLDHAPWNQGAKESPEDPLVVGLLAEGEIVELDAHWGIVTFGEGERMVLPVELGPTVHDVPMATLAKRAAEQGRPEAVGHVALVAETDETGAIVENEARRGSTAHHAYLDFAPADGGVLAYTPHADDGSEIELEMRKAPADGYGPTLDLAPASLGVRYFFVKIGDRFGRGWVTSNDIERTGEDRRASARVVLKLSREPGSRNLETR